MMITLTYLEFYSGIGGWGYALEHACRSIVQEAAIDVPSQQLHDAKRPKISIQHGNNWKEAGSAQSVELRAQLLAAYDHSNLCNSVFYQNHMNHHFDSPEDADHDDGNMVSSNEENALQIKQNNKKKQMQKQRKKEQKKYKPRQTPIERLTLTELQTHSADIWCMSPPCQPHTRQHSNQQNEKVDPRSQSFRHLCDLIGEMEEETLPALILLENVVGFEKSCSSWDTAATNDDEVIDVGKNGNGESKKSTDNEINDNNDSDDGGSFQTWRKALSQRNYHVGHFHLDPTHVGIPNNRPRHYTVAFRKDASFLQRKLNIGGGAVQPPFLGGDGRCDHLFCREALDKPPIIHDEKALLVEGRTKLPELPCVGSFLDTDLPPYANKSEAADNDQPSSQALRMKSLQIPEKFRKSSSSWCFDIATPYHKCTSCFTHSYGKFIRGTGSILYTGPLSLGGDDIAADTGVENNNGNGRLDDNACGADAVSTAEIDNAPPSIDRFQLESPEKRTFDASWSEDIDWDHHMRYLSGTEIARLMGFPVAKPGVATAVCDVASMDGKGKESIRKFSFPAECRMKQQWKLLGNSLNVRVAASVAEMGIRSVFNEVGL